MNENISIITEKTPSVIREREAYLIKLWGKDLDTQDCVAYHETSLEAIEILITTGRLPGHTGPTQENPNLPQLGDVYFTPRKNVFPFEKLPDIWLLDPRDKWLHPENFQDLSYSDDSLPIAHRFCSLLGIDISEFGMQAINYIHDLNGIKFLDFFEAEIELKKLGLTDEQMTEAYEQAKLRRGLVLGLNREALDQYQLTVGDGGYDFRLNGGLKGLPITAFSGIETLGPEETSFFQGLKNKLISSS